VHSIVAAVVLAVVEIVGSVSTYTVRPGDSLTRVGARFGISVGALAESNGLDESALLQIGQVLTIDNRHLVPAVDGANLVVNVPQRMLFWFTPAGTTRGFPVAGGKQDWRTPIGEFTVASKEVDPTWDVPVSIQEEMRREGKPVLTHVPPSRENPLGKFWIGLSIPGVGIHGTNAPASIYGLVTHGCIRLYPDDIAELFPRVEIGMRGKVIYEPVLTAYIKGIVYLEVHPDAYAKVGDLFGAAMEAAKSGGYADMIDSELAREVVRKHDGVPRDVTRRRNLE